MYLLSYWKKNIFFTPIDPQAFDLSALFWSNAPKELPSLSLIQLFSSF